MPLTTTRITRQLSNKTRLKKSVVEGGGGSGAETFTELTDTPTTITPDTFLQGNTTGSALRFVNPAWTDLTDTPSSLTAGQYVKANAGGTALEFTALPSIPSDWTDLDDTPGTITANHHVRGNSGGTALEFVDPTWTELSDTPGAISADKAVVGNAGGTALAFSPNDLSAYALDSDLTAYLRRDGSNTITGNIVSDTDNTRDWGAADGTNRFRSINGRLGNFVGGAAAPTIINPLAGTGGGVIAGTQGGYGSNLHELRAQPFAPVATMGNTYAYYVGTYGELINRGGGSTVFGSAYCYTGTTARIQSTGYGNFTAAYAFANFGDCYVINDGAGAFCGGYPNAQGGGSNHTVQASGAGSFCWGRTSGAAGDVLLWARGNGSFVQGFATVSNAASRARIFSGNNSNGSFAQGAVNAGGGFNADIIAGGNDAGVFAQGYAKSVTAAAFVRGNQDGAFAQGYALNANIDVAANGGFAHGFANGYNISVSAAGVGAGAFGYANAAAIAANAPNAFQFAEGVNAVADSLQVGQTTALGTGLHFHAGGVPAVPVNGDVWVDAAGFITMMSGGVVCVATNPVM